MRGLLAVPWTTYLQCSIKAQPELVLDVEQGLYTCQLPLHLCQGKPGQPVQAECADAARMHVTAKRCR